MAATKYAARDCEFEIEDYLNPGVWTDLPTGEVGEGGITTFSKGFEYEAADTTNFGSNGDAESQTMQVGKTIELEGFELKDLATGVLNAGQALVALQADRKGAASLTGFRFAAPGDTVWTVWAKARFELGESGGGNNDMVGWKVKVTRSGATTTVAKS